jgi:WD40 repeat protein
VVNSVAWSPDGRLVAFCGCNTHIWDATLNERYPPLVPHPKVHYTLVNSVAWSPDSRSLASAYDDGTIILWDAVTRAQRAILKGHTKDVKCVAWSPDGRRLASISQDETVRLWDVSSGQTLMTISPHQGQSVTLHVQSVAWSPDGRCLACGGIDDPLVFDASTGKRLFYHWVGHGFIYAAAWSPDGRRLATASGDPTIRLWDVQQNHYLATFFGHTDGNVLAVAWSPDGRLLASGGVDQTVRLWRVG